MFELKFRLLSAVADISLLKCGLWSSLSKISTKKAKKHLTQAAEINKELQKMYDKKYSHS